MWPERQQRRGERRRYDRSDAAAESSVQQRANESPGIRLRCECGIRLLRETEALEEHSEHVNRSLDRFILFLDENVSCQFLERFRLARIAFETANETRCWPPTIFADQARLKRRESRLNPTVHRSHQRLLLLPCFDR